MLALRRADFDRDRSSAASLFFFGNFETGFICGFSYFSSGLTESMLSVASRNSSSFASEINRLMLLCRCKVFRDLLLNRLRLEFLII